MKHISIVIPMYNEAEGLPALRARLTGVMDGLSDYTFEVLLVDDGSRDVSAEAALQMRREDGRFHLLRLSRNFGKEAAVLAGLDYADGDAVVLMDADLQDPPELIGRMLALWEEGYDDVYARRRSREGESGLKKFTSRCYYRMLARLSRTEIQPDTGDFRLFDRRCVLALRRLREQGRCGKSLFSWIGYRKKEILFDRDPRCAGETKWNYARLFELALDAGSERPHSRQGPRRLWRLSRCLRRRRRSGCRCCCFWPRCSSGRSGWCRSISGGRWQTGEGGPAILWTAMTE